MRWDSSTIVPASSRRVPVVARRRPSWSSVLAAPAMRPSGVRRSCESELSSAVRSRSASTSTARPAAPLGQRDALAARAAACAARASSSRRCAGIAELVPARRADAEHADRRGRTRRAARRARAPPAACSVPEAGRLAVVEGPLRDAALPSSIGTPARSPGCDPPVGVGQQHARRRRRTCRARASGDAALSSSRLARAGELAAQRVERRGAPLALARRLRLVPHAHGQPAHHQRDHEHHREGEHVARVARPRR